MHWASRLPVGTHTSRSRRPTRGSSCRTSTPARSRSRASPIQLPPRRRRARRSRIRRRRPRRSPTPRPPTSTPAPSPHPDPTARRHAGRLDGGPIGTRGPGDVRRPRVAALHNRRLADRPRHVGATTAPRAPDIAPALRPAVRAAERGSAPDRSAPAARPASRATSTTDPAGGGSADGADRRLDTSGGTGHHGGGAVGRTAASPAGAP